MSATEQERRAYIEARKPILRWQEDNGDMWLSTEARLERQQHEQCIADLDLIDAYRELVAAQNDRADLRVPLRLWGPRLEAAQVRVAELEADR